MAARGSYLQAMFNGTVGPLSYIPVLRGIRPSWPKATPESRNEIKSHIFFCHQFAVQGPLPQLVGKNLKLDKKQALVHNASTSNCAVASVLEISQ